MTNMSPATLLLLGLSAVLAETQTLKSHHITSKEDMVPLMKHHRMKRALFDGAERSEIVDQHNALRRQEDASNMQFMQWHPELAAMAEEWALTCSWGHGQPSRDTPPFDAIGQNLYATTANPFNHADGTQVWYDEKEFYDYDTLACSKPPCGHYTQVVWDTSRYVGCAYALCPVLENTGLTNAAYYVCNYGPAGNFVNQKIYKKGEACTQCESGNGWCSDGLCVDLDTPVQGEIECRATCQNCGQRVFEENESCRCECQVGWTGTDCSEECVDRDVKCGANPGWPESWCNRDFVRENCPAMCSLCTAGESDCSESEPSTTTEKASASTSSSLPSFTATLPTSSSTDSTTPTTASSSSSSTQSNSSPTATQSISASKAAATQTQSTTSAEETPRRSTQQPVVRPTTPRSDSDEDSNEDCDDDDSSEEKSARSSRRGQSKSWRSYSSRSRDRKSRKSRGRSH